MGNQYGSYVMYFLSNLLQKQNRKERYKEFGLFENDETGSEWHRQETLELLKKFCPEGYENACKYRHFIIGTSVGKNYIGIPGRFMLSEQPAQGSTGFTSLAAFEGRRMVLRRFGKHVRRGCRIHLRILDSLLERRNACNLRGFMILSKNVWKSLC